MSNMKKTVAPPVFLRAAETLLAYVGNLVAHPSDLKYRRIKACLAPPHAPAAHVFSPPGVPNLDGSGRKFSATQVCLHPFVAAAQHRVRTCWWWWGRCKCRRGMRYHMTSGDVAWNCNRSAMGGANWVRRRQAMRGTGPLLATSRTALPAWRPWASPLYSKPARRCSQSPPHYHPTCQQGHRNCTTVTAMASADLERLSGECDTHFFPSLI